MLRNIKPTAMIVHRWLIDFTDYGRWILAILVMWLIKYRICSFKWCMVVIRLQLVLHLLKKLSLLSEHFYHMLWYKKCKIYHRAMPIIFDMLSVSSYWASWHYVTCVNTCNIGMFLYYIFYFVLLPSKFCFRLVQKKIINRHIQFLFNYTQKLTQLNFKCWKMYV